MAAEIPLAGDLTAEADSGGHTDNRPAILLLPTLIALRDRLQAQYGYRELPRVGCAGGIATPQSTAAAFAMGAAYVLTGSVNQACVESGSSDLVRRMLAQAGQADVMMAPAADMFEMGVKVQVLKRGTMFPMRAAKLFELYRSCASLETIPAAERVRLERDLFRAPLERIWDETRSFWLTRDPAQVIRAESDAKHKMALTFRWYLGLSSRWANAGEPTRQGDYQVWCGPAMGAFNEWARGSFLEQPENRRVVTVARNLLHGAAVCTRIHALHCQGVTLPPDAERVGPIEVLSPES
jgi:PfaD family protein